MDVASSRGEPRAVRLRQTNEKECERGAFAVFAREFTHVEFPAINSMLPDLKSVTGEGDQEKKPDGDCGKLAGDPCKRGDRGRRDRESADGRLGKSLRR